MPCLRPLSTIQTLTGYATIRPTSTAADVAPQKASCVGSIARMSRPIINTTMVGNMPAIMNFIDSDWKMNKPNPKPAAYSMTRSIPIGSPSSPVMVAATMIPVASPATQWIVEPRPCFQSGWMKRSWVPGNGSLHDRTVEHEGDRPEIERDEHPAPFHDFQFWVVPPGVQGDVSHRDRREGEPDEEDEINPGERAVWREVDIGH